MRSLIYSGDNFARFTSVLQKKKNLSFCRLSVWRFRNTQFRLLVHLQFREKFKWRDKNELFTNPVQTMSRSHALIVADFVGSATMEGG